MSRRSRRRRRHGFTLMEVLLVLAILVILGTVVVANYSGIFASSKIKAAQTQISMFEQQLEYYQLDMSSYPSTQQGLKALWQAPQDADQTKWNGPYSKKEIPLDPWENEYIYNLVGPNQFEVFSAGPDGAPNTDDDVRI